MSSSSSAVQIATTQSKIDKNEKNEKIAHALIEGIVKKTEPSMLVLHEKRLLDILKTHNISDKEKGILNPDFKKYALNIEQPGQERKELNLKEFIQCIATPIVVFLNELSASDIDSLSANQNLQGYVKSALEMLQRLLESVEIFDREVQKSIQPLVIFLYRFNQVDPVGISSVLTSFEFIQRFTEEHEKRFKLEWDPRRDTVISEANKECAIQHIVNTVLLEYKKATDNSNMNNVYVRARLILKLSELQNEIKNGVRVLMGIA